MTVWGLPKYTYLVEMNTARTSWLGEGLDGEWLDSSYLACNNWSGPLPVDYRSRPNRGVTLESRLPDIGAARQILAILSRRP